MPSYRDDPVISKTSRPSGADNYDGGVYGESSKGEGVFGLSHGLKSGVVGINDRKTRRGSGGGGTGGWFESAQGDGVRSKSRRGVGVVAESETGNGVWAVSNTGVGITTRSDSNVALWAKSESWEAIHAESKSTTGAALAVFMTNFESKRPAIFAKHDDPRGVAAVFEGQVIVTTDIVLTNADCAEEFDIVDGELSDPGTVMVIAGDDELRASKTAYDNRVAGVISGGGQCKPGIILGRTSVDARKAIALTGKVYCKVDATFAAVEIGDLLTTSPTEGHAMKAVDQMRAFGSVIGKALSPLRYGCGLIPILVALQ